MDRAVISQCKNVWLSGEVEDYEIFCTLAWSTMLGTKGD